LTEQQRTIDEARRVGEVGEPRLTSFARLILGVKHVLGVKPHVSAVHADEGVADRSDLDSINVLDEKVLNVGSYVEEIGQDVGEFSGSRPSLAGADGTDDLAAAPHDRFLSPPIAAELWLFLHGREPKTFRRKRRAERIVSGPLAAYSGGVVRGPPVKLLI